MYVPIWSWCEFQHFTWSDTYDGFIIFINPSNLTFWSSALLSPIPFTHAHAPSCTYIMLKPLQKTRLWNVLWIVWICYIYVLVRRQTRFFYSLPFICHLQMATTAKCDKNEHNNAINAAWNTQIWQKKKKIIMALAGICIICFIAKLDDDMFCWTASVASGHSNKQRKPLQNISPFHFWNELLLFLLTRMRRFQFMERVRCATFRTRLIWLAYDLKQDTEERKK